MKAIIRLISKLFKSKERITNKVIVDIETKQPDYLIIQNKDFCPKRTILHNKSKYESIKNECKSQKEGR